MALYHCCMSAALAQAGALVGFPEDELIAVTESPPRTDANDPDAAYAVVLLEPPADFRLDEHPARLNRHGQTEYLVPGRTLNAFQRLAWPSAESRH